MVWGLVLERITFHMTVCLTNTVTPQMFLRGTGKTVVHRNECFVWRCLGDVGILPASPFPVVRIRKTFGKKSTDIIRTVHVTSYLRKSADFHGNPSWISMKVCVEIRGSSVASPWNHLSGSAELSFRNPRNCLSGIHGGVFQESAELFFGRPRIHLVGVLQTIFGRPQVIESAKSSSGICEIVLWNRKSCVNRYAISFERFAATLQGIIPQVCTEVPQIPSNVSAYILRWFRGRFTEVCKLLHGISQKTYEANPWNSITNLWHVPYVHISVQSRKMWCGLSVFLYL